MKQWLLLILSSTLMVGGCSKKIDHSTAGIKSYESSIDAVINNNSIESKEIPFDYELRVYKLENNSYNYEVVISNAKVAMYDIQAIVVNPELDSNTNVHPCLGLLGEDTTQEFHMVPNQSNPKRGYYKGFSLEGISEKNQFTLHGMVMWVDSDRLTHHRAFFNVSFVEDVNDQSLGEKQTKDQ